MKKIILIVIIVSIVSISYYALTLAKENRTQEIVNVIHIAEKCLIDNKIEIEDYKLIKVENLYINNSKYIGPDRWYVVFKLRSIIPKEENRPLGIGGEIFIEVNSKDKNAKILGYGE